MRRSRRTQRGGFSFSSLFGSSDNVTDLEKELAQATDPDKISDLKKQIKLAELKQKYDEDKKMIENGTAAEGAASSVSSNSAASSQSPYNSSASTGAGQMSSTDANMYSGIGGRRRSRRYRRK